MARAPCPDFRRVGKALQQSWKSAIGATKPANATRVPLDEEVKSNHESDISP
jgi:hypothetical protein